MSDAVCPLCGSRENQKSFSDRNYDVLACKNCELFFIHPYGSSVHEKVATYDYQDDHLEMINPARQYASSRSYYKRKYFSYVKEECAGVKSILDIGCGTGALLGLMREEMPHLQRAGIELNIARAEFAKKVADCEIYRVPMEEFTYDGKFDVITLMNVLSHIPSFDGLFASIHRLIAPRGKLILKVGEMTADVKKDAIYDWGIPDHLHFLGMKTMQFICDKYGFKILRHERQPLSADIFSFYRWMTLGRSAVRDLAKRAIALTPFVLPILRARYDKKHGNTFYSSFIVVSPAGG